MDNFDFLTFFYTFYSSKMGWHRNLLHFMLYWNWITKKYSTLSALVLYVIVYWKRMEISSLLSALVIFFILYWNWMTKKSSLLSPDAPPDHCSNSTTNNPHQLCVLDKKRKGDMQEKHHCLKKELSRIIQWNASQNDKCTKTATQGWKISFQWKFLLNLCEKGCLISGNFRWIQLEKNSQNALV